AREPGGPGGRRAAGRGARRAPREPLAVFDVGVIAANARFLILQGLLGLGGFAGGTLRLAVPAIVLGFLLGILVALGRLARSRWVYGPTTVYVEVIRGVPLVMVIFW